MDLGRNSAVTLPHIQDFSRIIALTVDLLQKIWLIFSRAADSSNWLALVLLYYSQLLDLDRDLVHVLD